MSSMVKKLARLYLLVYMCLCVCIYTYINLFSFKDTCLLTSFSLNLCSCTRSNLKKMWNYICVCVYVCVYVCICVCLCVFIFIQFVCMFYITHVHMCVYNLRTCTRSNLETFVRWCV